MDRAALEPSTRTPRDVFDLLRASVLSFDVDDQAALFADDVVVEFPYAPDRFPRRIEGRDAFVAALRPVLERAKGFGHQLSDYEALVIHETDDPEVLIAEFEVVGRMSSDGSEFRLPYVQRLRVRDGQIVDFRDYWPPQTAAVAAAAIGSHSND